ncbi:hypothetical protein I553_0218 [Mycobacterium xenopi 4042]|uniref:Uncharacterized protein n=1 Tax=Mycobacterium xenopi 4042 TaxID=1299334 RepID=X7YJ68_MYCXE|nr:hypothetical protein I553_0218 [Mycobacterium xenopi 4042]EUA19478.1 hypothetical protein I552_9221 [Mycobacterium xenopi 3993]
MDLTMYIFCIHSRDLRPPFLCCLVIKAELRWCYTVSF